MAVVTTSGTVPKDRTQIAQTGRGIVAEVFPLAAGSANLALTTQQIYAAAVGLRGGDVILGAGTTVQVAGTSTAPTLIKLALLDKTGKVLGQTANVAADAGWTAIQSVQYAFVASVTVPSDDIYYWSILENGAFAGTAMNILRGLSSATVSTTLSGGSKYVAAQTGQTDYPATNSTVTLATLTAVPYGFVY